MTEIWNGITIDPSLLPNFGFNEVIDDGDGIMLPRFLAYMSAGIAEAGSSIDASAAGFVASSTTSTTVGAGAKSLTIETGKGFVSGLFVLAYSAADPSKFMSGLVTGYTSGTGALNFTVQAGDFGGSGTVTDWVVALSSKRGLQGLTGLSYAFSTTTTAGDPGAGLFRANNATISSATALYVDYTDAFGRDVSAILATFDDSTSTVKGQILIRSQVDLSQEALFNVTGVTDSTGYYTIAVTYVGPATSPTWSASMALMLDFSRVGDKGEPFNTGQAFTFDTSTTASDPGAGKIRFNNGTLSSATAAYVDVLDANSADVSGWLAGLSASTGTVKGTLRIQSLTTPTKFAEFNLTAATNSTGYYTLALSYVSPASAPTFTASEAVSLIWSRAGDLGPTGAGSTVFTAVNGVSVGTARATLNFITSDGMSISAVDNSGAGRTDITLTPSFASAVATPLVTSNTTLTLTQAGALLNSTGGAFTLTLPASPPTGTAYRLVDVGQMLATNNVTLARPGGVGTIMGLAQDCLLNISGIELTVWFNGSEWRFQ